MKYATFNQCNMNLRRYFSTSATEIGYILIAVQIYENENQQIRNNQRNVSQSEEKNDHRQIIFRTIFQSKTLMMVTNLDPIWIWQSFR